MSLLSDLVETSVDPGYRRSVDRGDVRGAPGATLVTLLLAGALFGTAFLVSSREAPQVAQERSALIAQVKQQQSDHERLRARLTDVEGEVDRLQRQALGPSASPDARQAVGLSAGSVRVTGPGVVIVVDDSRTRQGTDAEVVDQDLRQLVNGLWTAGAEAIAINGHRLSARTAIRGAGNAITVDYASLTRPYTVEAIGDPATLAARLTETDGGRWWIYLEQNYGMRYEIGTARSIVLEPDPGLRAQKARPVK